MDNNSSKHDLIASRQEMLLKHLWESVETVKQYRLRIPTLIGTLNLVLVSFVYQSTDIPSSFSDKIIFSVASLLIMGIGIGGLFTVHITYRIFGKRLKHLYNAMDMNNTDFFSGASVYFAWPIWLISYLTVFILGVFSAIALLMAPLRIAG